MENIDFNSLLGNNEYGIVNLDKYRKSPSPGASASRPKYVMDIDGVVAYFKFGLTAKEICAEIFAYHIAVIMGIPVAETRLAVYKQQIGIVSFDVGDYIEPSDDMSYSVKDFINIGLFVEMCLFDYLVMNEDRHCRNWGIHNGFIAPLYDHNICFSTEYNENDLEESMLHLTSAFYVDTEYEMRQDSILKYMTINYKERVIAFTDSLERLNNLAIINLEYIYPAEYNRIMEILKYRIIYMRNVVSKWIES